VACDQPARQGPRWDRDCSYHDVSDDWNLTREWRDQAWRRPAARGQRADPCARARPRGGRPRPGPAMVVSATPAYGLERQERRQKFLVDKLGAYEIDFEAWHSILQGLCDFLQLLGATVRPWPSGSPPSSHPALRKSAATCGQTVKAPGGHRRPLWGHDPYAGHPRTPSTSGGRFQLVMPPRGLERPGRVVRFARLIQRPVRDLGGPADECAWTVGSDCHWRFAAPDQR
jgi:hypothetical protein